MKKLFSVLLVLSALTELMAAGTLIAGPGGVAAAGQGGQWSMHYGFAALAFASASLWVWPRRSNWHAVTAILGVLMVFHTGLLVSLALAGDQMVGMVLHAILSALCILLFTQRTRWCEPAGNTAVAAAD